nr:hypothetical protein [Tanacetum cinerariifolium]
MADRLPILKALVIESHSNQLNNKTKVWLSEEVGSEDGFARDMSEQCYFVRMDMEKRARLMSKLEKHAVCEGATRYLEILRCRQERDTKKLHLLRDLVCHAHDEANERQLALDIVDHS